MRYYYSLILAFLATEFSDLSAQKGFVADKVEGCGSLTVKFTPDLQTTSKPYFWDFGDGRNSKDISPAITYTQPGLYTVKLTIGSADTTRNNYIKVRSMPDARFIINDSINTGPYIFKLYAAQQPVDTFTYTYAWNFSDNTSATSPVLAHQFDSSGIYFAKLKVTDDFGCVDSFQHLIRAISKIIVPNIFTPNDDGRNDVLEVQTNGRSIYQFMVYSPSGMLVYKTESAYIRWGGENLSGAKLNAGVYYYTIKSLDSAIPLTQSGFIYLLR